MNGRNFENGNASLTDRFARPMRLTCAAKNEGGDEAEKEDEGRQASGESNGYSRINPSIMSSASEFPRCGERLEIIKQRGGGRRGTKGGREGGEWAAGSTGRTGGSREVSALARVIVRGNKI